MIVSLSIMIPGSVSGTIRGCAKQLASPVFADNQKANPNSILQMPENIGDTLRNLNKGAGNFRQNIEGVLAIFYIFNVLANLFIKHRINQSNKDKDIIPRHTLGIRKIKTGNPILQ